VGRYYSGAGTEECGLDPERLSEIREGESREYFERKFPIM